MVLPGSYTAHLDGKATKMPAMFIQKAFQALPTSKINSTDEHEVFVAFWKRRVPVDQIMARLIQSFPNLVTFNPPLEDKRAAHLATAMVIRQWLKWAASDDAPMQRPSVSLVLTYSWGPALITHDFKLWAEGGSWAEQIYDVPLWM